MLFILARAVFLLPTSCEHGSSMHFILVRVVFLLPTSCEHEEWCDFANFKRVRERSVLDVRDRA